MVRRSGECLQAGWGKGPDREAHAALRLRLIRRRRECPELGFGTLELLDAGTPSVLAHRCDWEGSTIVAVHELAGRAAEVALPLDDGDALVDLFDDHEHPLPATLPLEPYAASWFRVRRGATRLAP